MNYWAMEELLLRKDMKQAASRQKCRQSAGASNLSSEGQVAPIHLYIRCGTHPRLLVHAWRALVWMQCMHIVYSWLHINKVATCRQLLETAAVVATAWCCRLLHGVAGSHRVWSLQRLHIICTAQPTVGCVTGCGHIVAGK